MKTKSSKRPTFLEEEKLWATYDYVIGIDEVGRGSWAGPVVVAGVVFKKNCHKEINKDLQNLLLSVNDSKLVKPEIRSILNKEIKDCCLVYSIATIPLSIINKQGIARATYKGMRNVVTTLRKKLKTTATFVLIDGNVVKRIPGGIKHQKAIIKGDQKSLSIAAASILAKVFRDELMDQLEIKYPHYLFSKNKGYGTSYHQKALKKYGLSRVHRRSFNLEKFL